MRVRADFDRLESLIGWAKARPLQQPVGRNKRSALHRSTALQTRERRSVETSPAFRTTTAQCAALIAPYDPTNPHGHYAVLLTPQKNGSGPLTIPLTFLRHAWYSRKKPVGA
jgi:hypothetical protein